MSEQEFDREMRYQAAVQIADALLKKGSISEEEYHQIKTKLLEKYRPTLSTLLSGKPLQTVRKLRKALKNCVKSDIINI